MKKVSLFAIFTLIALPAFAQDGSELCPSSLDIQSCKVENIDSDTALKGSEAPAPLALHHVIATCGELAHQQNRQFESIAQQDEDLGNSIAQLKIGEKPAPLASLEKSGVEGNKKVLICREMAEGTFAETKTEGSKLAEASDPYQGNNQLADNKSDNKVLAIIVDPGVDPKVAMASTHGLCRFVTEDSRSEGDVINTGGKLALKGSERTKGGHLGIACTGDEDIINGGGKLAVITIGLDPEIAMTSSFGLDDVAFVTEDSFGKDIVETVSHGTLICRESPCGSGLCISNGPAKAFCTNFHRSGKGLAQGNSIGKATCHQFGGKVICRVWPEPNPAGRPDELCDKCDHGKSVCDSDHVGNGKAVAVWVEVWEASLCNTGGTESSDRRITAGMES